MPLPSNNPFTPNNPIDEEERFFGQEDMLDWLGDRFLSGERFVLVYGTARVGKTSLLRRLRTKMASSVSPVYIDLEALPQSQDLLWALFTELHYKLGQGREEWPPLPEEASSSQEDCIRRVLLPLWRPFLRGKPLALLLDGTETERFQEGIWADLVLRLRKLIEEESDLCAVLTVRGASSAMPQPVPALRGPVFRDMGYLSEEQTEELLVGLARYQLAFDYDALRRIHTLTGGHPYLVQLYGFELYRHLAPHGQITIHAVGDLLPVVLNAAGPLFEDEWAALSQDARVVLAAFGAMQGFRGTVTPFDVAIFLRNAGAGHSSKAVEVALQELCGRRIMRWFGGTAYAARMELWRAWLVQTRPLSDVLHGKRRRREAAPRLHGRLGAVDWGTILPWVGAVLAVVVVVWMWNWRGRQAPSALPVPSLTAGQPTVRPTPTRVLLPGRIAYMSQAGPHEPWCIWTMRDNGTDPVRISEGTSDDTMPTYSPDGKQLAFVSNRSGNRDVWVMNADGLGLANITNTASDEWNPAWSPDGTDIAFASYRDGNWEIYLAKPDGSEVRRITRNGAPDYAPAWSPDGAKLAFVSERDGNSEIYVVNRDGTGLQRLTENLVTDLYPQWSPDGKRIAFASYRDGNMEIYTMAPDGSDPVNLSNRPDSDEHQPAWSPDGKWLALYSNADGNWDIFIMLADGSQQVNLTMSPASEQGPVWQPRTAEP